MHNEFEKDLIMTQNGHHDAFIVETTDEEGEIHLFEKVEEFELDGQQYALLIYLGAGDDEDDDAEGDDDGEAKPEKSDDDDDEDGYEEEIVVMRIKHEPDGQVFEAIEDEEEFEKVVRYIEEMSEGDDDE